MKVIGLTGGIGSGKSTVSKFLAELGAVVLDADKIGHEAFQPGTDAWCEVTAAFGTGVLDDKGEIDRRKLARLVFEDPAALSRLNSIMHPRMYEIVKAKIEECRRQGVAVVVLEAPLLFEAGWMPLVDEVWATVAPERMVLKRIEGRGGLSETEALARIRAQLSAEERIRRAEVVIDTDCSLDELRGKVRELWRRVSPGGKAELDVRHG